MQRKSRCMRLEPEEGSVEEGTFGGTTNLFVQLFGAEAGHVRLVCDVY